MLVLILYADSKSIDKAKDMVLSLYLFVQNMPYPEEWLAKLEGGDFFDSEVFDKLARQSIKGKCLDVLHILNWLSDYYTKPNELGKPRLSSIEALNAADKQNIEWVMELVDTGSWEQLKAALESFSWTTARAAKEEKDFWDSVKDELKKEREKAKKILKPLEKLAAWACEDGLEKEKALMLCHIQFMCKAVRSLDKIFGAKKRRSGLMDFSDSAHFALKILQNPEVAEEYRNQFKYIFTKSLI